MDTLLFSPLTIFRLMCIPPLNTIQPTAKRITTPRCSFDLRGLAFLVMVAIVLQAFISPCLRIAARAHFHLDATAGTLQDRVIGHSQADHDADEEHAHPHPHSHTHLATHEHDVESNDVVYVDNQNSEPPSGPAFNRVALDLDGLLLHRVPPLINAPTQLVFAEIALRFRSRIEPPLERPPRLVI